MSKFKEVEPLWFPWGTYCVVQAFSGYEPTHQYIQYIHANTHPAPPQWNYDHAVKLRDWLNLALEGTPTGSEP
jgi:hypothetical protein